MLQFRYKKALILVFVLFFGTVGTVTVSGEDTLYVNNTVHSSSQTGGQGTNGAAGVPGQNGSDGADGKAGQDFTQSDARAQASVTTINDGDVLQQITVSEVEGNAVADVVVSSSTTKPATATATVAATSPLPVVPGTASGSFKTLIQKIERLIQTYVDLLF